MPYRKKTAGGSTFNMANQRHKTMIIIAVIGTAIFAILIIALNNTTALGIGGMGFLVLLILIKILPDVLDKALAKKQKEEKRAIRGAKAEVIVDSLLDELSEDYYVLNDVNTPYGNIDHIVLSKENGLYLIETKSHFGKVSIQGNTLYLNGHLTEKDFFAQTLKNSYWLRNRITEITGVTPWITPIILFTNALVPFSNPVKGIRVINKRFLLQTIMNTSNKNPANRALWERKESILSNLT